MTDITITKGSTFTMTIRWESLPLVYTAITAITKAAPAVVTSTSHGLKTGWRAAILSVGGMRQIKSKNTPPRSSDFKKVTFVSSSQVSFNDIDSSDYTTYTSGGYLCSYTPVSLASFTARMKIRSTALDATELESLTSSAGITLDDTEHTIEIVIPAADTAAYDFTEGVYDLELASGDATPVVTKLLSGNVFVEEEVTW